MDTDWVLWGAGTALGLVTACWIPYLMMTRHTITPDSVFGGWLIPVVPPMVSAATGALLIPHLASALATAVTIRTAREGLPFGLTWWSFTFPVGTCVTGTISLAARTHSEVLRGASLLFFALLAGAWLVVATRTATGSARGRLLLPPPGQPQP